MLRPPHTIKKCCCCEQSKPINLILVCRRCSQSANYSKRKKFIIFVSRECPNVFSLSHLCSVDAIACVIVCGKITCKINDEFLSNERMPCAWIILVHFSSSSLCGSLSLHNSHSCVCLLVHVLVCVLSRHVARSSLALSVSTTAYSSCISHSMLPRMFVIRLSLHKFALNYREYV